MRVLISVVIPALNEIESLPYLLRELGTYLPEATQLIVVDAGSDDGTAEFLVRWMEDGSHGIALLGEQAGRASQMEAGVGRASGQYIWFLHADSRVDRSLCETLIQAIDRGSKWGRFDVRLDAEQRVFRVVERLMNWRSCITGICTGDQGIFVSRDVLQGVGGVPQLALMEDIALSKKLKLVVRPTCLRQRLVTSARRWQSNGVLRTVVLMWSLRLAYFLGVDTHRLKQWYRSR